MAQSEMYTYCPGWALSWGYRKQALLREILSQRADIICLQEVRGYPACEITMRFRSPSFLSTRNYISKAV
eukprot:2367731-Pyramimonas_sp.AAC.2